MNNLPKKLNLTDAYRNNPYVAKIPITKDGDKPTVEAKLYSSAGGNLIKSELQPGELEVAKNEVHGGWEAKLSIPNCKQLPDSTFIEIYVNGHVDWAGTLKVGYSTTA